MRNKYSSFHDGQEREEVVVPSSDRVFGLVIAGFFTLCGGLSLYHGGERWPVWLALAATFAGLAVVRPGLLAPLNRLWTKFGLLLHAVVSPIILGLIFFACITPIGFLMRLFGQDPLRRRFEPAAESYWLRREPPAPDSFKNQF